MFNIIQLQKSAEDALRKAFSEKCNTSDIEVYDHTEEIFDKNFEGVSVWCDINRRVLSWFDGNPNFIISNSYVLGEVSIDLFLGDECTDMDAAIEAADGFYCDDVWHIEQIDDFLMLQASFTLDSPDTLEENIAKKLKMLEDCDFVEAIQPVISYFE
jgi:hypothetical protein